MKNLSMMIRGGLAVSIINQIRVRASLYIWLCMLHGHPGLAPRKRVIPELHGKFCILMLQCISRVYITLFKCVGKYNFMPVIQKD